MPFYLINWLPFQILFSIPARCLYYMLWLVNESKVLFNLLSRITITKTQILRKKENNGRLHTNKNIIDSYQNRYLSISQKSLELKSFKNLKVLHFVRWKIQSCIECLKDNFTDYWKLIDMWETCTVLVYRECLKIGQSYANRTNA